MENGSIQGCAIIRRITDSISLSGACRRRGYGVSPSTFAENVGSLYLVGKSLMRSFLVGNSSLFIGKRSSLVGKSSSLVGKRS